MSSPKQAAGFAWSPAVSQFDQNGRIQPLNCKRGELANWIIIVGDPERVNACMKLFDNEDAVIECKSDMIYRVATGSFKGKPLSVVGTGMGFLATEVFVSQARQICDGELNIIRFGSCGCVRDSFQIGGFAVSDRTSYIRIDPSSVPPYEVGTIALPVGLWREIEAAFRTKSKFPVDVGLTLSADTFYGSQGRTDKKFDDDNGGLIDAARERWQPAWLNFEMEMFELAWHAEEFGNIRTGCVCITLAQRCDTTGTFLPVHIKEEMEAEGMQILFELIAEAQS